jgi:hypothetical protein
MADQWLAIVDADKIHDYVFSPHELKLVKGGSFLQWRLNTLDLKRKVLESRGRLVSASGGTVVARFETAEQAQGFCRIAASEFHQKTSIATVSSAVERFPSGEWSEAKLKLDALLELDKFGKRAPCFRGAGPFWATCQACGMQSAAHAYYPSEKKWICDACRFRKEESGKGPRWLRPYQVETFEDIGTAAKPENYMAFVYVDLDRLGRYMRDHGTTQERWKRLSRDVNSAIVASVVAGCETVKKAEAPVQVLLAGGDDAIVVLPANHIFRFLQSFSERYRMRRFLAGDAPQPTYSAGVVMAHSHYPIFEFRRLAEELLRSAKQIDREGEKIKPASVDFAILTASMTDSVLRDRDRLVRRTLGPRRTASPYTLDEFLRLEEHVRLLKDEGVPSAQVRRLYPMVYQGEMQAELDYLYLLSRLQKNHRQALLDTVGPCLWRNGPHGSRVTEAADLVEIWHFIQ